MVTIEPITYEKCTAFKERKQIADKVNEIIDSLNDGSLTGVTPEQLDSAIQEVNENIESVEDSVTDVVDRVDEVEDDVSTISDTVTTHTNQISEATEKANSALSQLTNKADLIDLTDGSVTKLGTSTIGSSTKPVYWNAGKPVAIASDVITINESHNTQNVTGYKTLQYTNGNGNLCIKGSSTQYAVLRIVDGALYTPEIRFWNIEPRQKQTDDGYWALLFYCNYLSGLDVFPKTQYIDIVDIETGVFGRFLINMNYLNTRLVKLWGDFSIDNIIMCVDDGVLKVFTKITGSLKPAVCFLPISRAVVENIEYNFTNPAWYSSNEEFVNHYDSTIGLNVPEIDNYSTATWYVAENETVDGNKNFSGIVTFDHPITTAGVKVTVPAGYWTRLYRIPRVSGGVRALFRICNSLSIRTLNDKLTCVVDGISNFVGFTTSSFVFNLCATSEYVDLWINNNTSSNVIIYGECEFYTTTPPVTNVGTPQQTQPGVGGSEGYTVVNTVGTW